jgi:hypothetical protein
VVVADLVVVVTSAVAVSTAAGLPAADVSRSELAIAEEASALAE